MYSICVLAAAWSAVDIVGCHLLKRMNVFLLDSWKRSHHNLSKIKSETCFEQAKTELQEEMI